MTTLEDGVLTLDGVRGGSLGDFLGPKVCEVWKVVIRNGRLGEADALANLPDLQVIQVTDSSLEAPFPLRLAPSVFSVELTRSDVFLDLRATRFLRELKVTGGEVGAAVEAPRLRSGTFRESTVDVVAALARTRVFPRLQMTDCRLVGAGSGSARCLSLTIYRCTSDDWRWLTRLEYLRSLYFRGDDLPPASVLHELRDLRLLHLPGGRTYADMEGLAAQGVHILVGRSRAPFPGPTG